MRAFALALLAACCAVAAVTWDIARHNRLEAERAALAREARGR